jgi:hypothetical protein
MFWWIDWQENCGKVADFLNPKLLFTETSTRFLANLHSKFECPSITKNVFLKIRNNFYIGIIWTYIVNFGEHARKQFQHLGFLKGFDQVLRIWPKVYLKIWSKPYKTCLRTNYTWLSWLIRVFSLTKHLGCYSWVAGFCSFSFFSERVQFRRVVGVALRMFILNTKGVVWYVCMQRKYGTSRQSLIHFLIQNCAVSVIRHVFGCKVELSSSWIAWTCGPKWGDIVRVEFF